MPWIVEDKSTDVHHHTSSLVSETRLKQKTMHDKKDRPTATEFMHCAALIINEIGDIQKIEELDVFTYAVIPMKDR